MSSSRNGKHILHVMLQIKVGRYIIGLVELSAKILQIMRSIFEDYAQSFCQLCAKCVRHFLRYITYFSYLKTESLSN